MKVLIVCRDMRKQCLIDKLNSFECFYTHINRSRSGNKIHIFPCSSNTSIEKIPEAFDIAIVHASDETIIPQVIRDCVKLMLKFTTPGSPDMEEENIAVLNRIVRYGVASTDETSELYVLFPFPERENACPITKEDLSRIEGILSGTCDLFPQCCVNLHSAKQESNPIIALDVLIQGYLIVYSEQDAMAEARERIKLHGEKLHSVRESLRNEHLFPSAKEGVESNSYWFQDLYSYRKLDPSVEKHYFKDDDEVTADQIISKLENGEDLSQGYTGALRFVWDLAIGNRSFHKAINNKQVLQLFRRAHQEFLSVD